MFNPKENLLDQQLAVSGLEMSIEPISATFMAISAVSSIAGGISGSRSAAKQNKKAREAEREQQKLLNQQARIQNRYNARKAEVDRENYEKQAEYNFETALQNWRYNTSIRAIQEKVDAQKYLMNVENSQKQLSFNKIAEQQGLTKIQLAVNDARSEDAFSKQDALIAHLTEQGRARLGQAGRSLQKRAQSIDAKRGRDLAVLNASLTGEITKSHFDAFDVRLGRFAADARVEAARMLRPERLPDLPAPTKPPEPTWLDPMKIIPGMATPAQQQSVSAPLLSGIGAAAGSLAQIDYSPAPGSGQPAPLIPTGDTGFTTPSLKSSIPFSAGIYSY